jgi:hypothetical protein
VHAALSRADTPSHTSLQPTIRSTVLASTFVED